MAFHPNYQENGKFYVHYTDGSGTIISEFQVTSDPNVADSNSERIILPIFAPGTLHQGGQLHFGLDGYLYISMGENGNAANSQNINNLLGKVLRIDVDNPDKGFEYGIPADNPFAKTEGRDEIFAYGFRNPWRFSIDSTGRLFLGDVGHHPPPLKREGLELVINGGNYGWPIMEGSICFQDPNGDCDMTGLELPIYDYHRNAWHAVTGGYVYEGNEIPELDGVYIFGDVGISEIWALKEILPGYWVESKILASTPAPAVTLGEDKYGEIYYASFITGKVYKIKRTP